MLPFLKNKDEASVSGPVDSIKRKPDDGGGDEFGMLDAVAEDMLDALDKKDKIRLKSALGALCDYVRMQDSDQDEQDFGF